VLLGWAGVSIAMAPNRCVGVVECASAEGEAKIAEQLAATPVSPITVDPGLVTPATAAADSVPGATTTVATTVAPTTTVPVAERPPIAIGESVMLGATSELQAGGFFVNADVSRTGEGIANIIGQYRASGTIGKIIVIQAGTNGPVSAATYDQIMSHLPADEVSQVVFLTVKAPKGWIDGNNALIWALPGKYPNVSVLDWAGLANQISGELSGSDGGVHLRTDKAKQFYANYIFGAIGHNELIQALPE
jgi:hypothetical protein